MVSEVEPLYSFQDYGKAFPANPPQADFAVTSVLTNLPVLKSLILHYPHLNFILQQKFYSNFVFFEASGARDVWEISHLGQHEKPKRRPGAL